MIRHIAIETHQGAAVCHESAFGGYVLDVECLTLDAAKDEAARMNRKVRAAIAAFERDARARIERRCVRFFPNEH